MSSVNFILFFLLLLRIRRELYGYFLRYRRERVSRIRWSVRTVCTLYTHAYKADTSGFSGSSDVI